MTTKQYLQLQDIYAENCDASGNLTTLYPALGLGVKGNYQVGILNASALDTSGVESWMFAIGQDFDSDTHILYENSNVSYEVNGTSGLFTVSGMEGTRTDEMVEWIGDQETPTVVGELIGMGADHNKNKPVSLIQWRMFMRNRVDPEGEEPSVVPNYATVDDLENLVHKKTTIPDTEFALNEEDGDSYTDAYPTAPDFAYFTIPATLSAVKVENEDAYMLNGMHGVSGNITTGVTEEFQAPIKLVRTESSQEGMAEYSASAYWTLAILNYGFTYDTYDYKFDLEGMEDGTVVDGAALPQWTLKVNNRRDSNYPFVEIMRLYGPRNTEVDNLFIPVSGGDFTGDISQTGINEGYSYEGDLQGPLYDDGGVTYYMKGGNSSVIVSDGVLFVDGFGRTVTMRIGGRIRQVWVGIEPIAFTQIPNTRNFIWEFINPGLNYDTRFVLDRKEDDSGYSWKTYFRSKTEGYSHDWEYSSAASTDLPEFDPFKNYSYATVSGDVFENGIYDGRQTGEPIPYYVTDHLEGVSGESVHTSGSLYYTIGVPSAIDVEMTDTHAILKKGFGTKTNTLAFDYNDKWLVRQSDGVYTANGLYNGIGYSYTLTTDATGASLLTTYQYGASAGVITTLTGNTEEREKPTYLPYLTNGEFNYEDEVQSLTTDSGNLTIYDNPWKQPDYLRAKVLLPGNRVWEGTLPRYANTGTYLRSSFIYEGLAIFRIGVSVASNPPNYIIAYDSGGESGDWDIPQEFGTHRFIPTSGGTFTGAISASDSQPYATSGYYEGLIQSKIDNPVYAGDNYAASYNMSITDDFLPFPGNPQYIPDVFGPLNQSSIGTVATRELQVNSTYGNINWHEDMFTWIHKPVTVNDGAEHNYYITVRLNIVSTDPYELASDGSLWTLDCWKID